LALGVGVIQKSINVLQLRHWRKTKLQNFTSFFKSNLQECPHL